MCHTVRCSASLLAGLLVIAIMAGCSNDKAKMSNDEAISILEGQGYTAQSAQCLIDGATQQNVDIYTFLVSDKIAQQDFDVVKTVGAYCIEHYGFNGTVLPGTPDLSTTVPPG
jgi:predicted exporter